jgi:prolyl-tRNA synthetase
MRGVPIRLEIGGKDLEKSEVRCVKRNDGTKQQLPQEGLADKLNELLVQIHDEMYQKALQSRQDHVKNIDNWKDFMEALNGRNLCMAPWCNV